jgi:hypothetical protein
LASENRLWKSRKAKPASQLSHSLDYYDFLTGYGIRILRARSSRESAHPVSPSDLNSPVKVTENSRKPEPLRLQILNPVEYFLSTATGQDNAEKKHSIFDGQ